MMKCGQLGCRRSAEIYNLGSDRWECVVHHRTIRSVAASRRTRIEIRARRERQRAERNTQADITTDDWVALLASLNPTLDE